MLTYHDLDHFMHMHEGAPTSPLPLPAERREERGDRPEPAPGKSWIDIIEQVH